MTFDFLFLINRKQFSDIDSQTHQHNLCTDLFHSSSAESDIAHILLELTKGSFRLYGPVHPYFDSSDAEKIFPRK